MDKIIVIPNKKRDENLKITTETVNMFSKKFDVCMSNEYNFIENAEFYENDKLFDCGAKFAVTIGGDGTILTTASNMLPHSIPILGINLGHLGFLTAIEHCELEKYFSAIINGCYTVEERMMIEATIVNNNCTTSSYYALNDIVIARGALSRILHTTTEVDGCVLNSFDADGIIFSTPTGSTAYSLSSGGPIISPEVEAVLITAISPHNMGTRPIVIPADKCIKVNVSDCGESRAYLSADGRHGINLSDNDTVIIKKSNYKTFLIRLKNLGFYETVRKKFSQRGL